jgi:hypothetical protein
LNSKVETVIEEPTFSQFIEVAILIASSRSKPMNSQMTTQASIN